MLNKEQLKELVKAHFNLVDAPQPTTEEKFGEIADENKAFIIKFPGDTLEVDSPVTVVTEEGQEAPAPNGVHKLEDGKIITVEDGVVTKIEEPTTEEELGKKEEMAEEPVVDAVEEAVSDAIEETVAEVVEEAVDTAAIVEAVVEAVKSEMDMMKKEIMEMKDKYSQFAATPAGSKTLPIPTKTVEHSFDIESAANADRIKQTIELIKNKKK
jgi:hypothetical protein